jgi:hypothetical protein
MSLELASTGILYEKQRNMYVIKHILTETAFFYICSVSMT